MKIKMITSRAGAHFAHLPGDILTVPDDITQAVAEGLIVRNAAEEFFDTPDAVADLSAGDLAYVTALEEQLAMETSLRRAAEDRVRSLEAAADASGRAGHRVNVGRRKRP